MSSLHERIEAFYRFLWPFLSAEEARFAFLDDAPGGRPASEFLNELPARHGLGPGSRLLDIGCGTGKQVRELAQRLGCHVIGVDPLDQNLELARGRVRQGALADRVTIEKGTIERIPLEDASVDFVWCRDTFNHVEDIERALAECARVLKPGGSMMNCSALATEAIEPAEVKRLTTPLGINPDTLSPSRMESAYHAAGLHIMEYGNTTEEGSPFLEQLDEGSARDMLRLAKMIRAPSRTRVRLGAEHFELLLAYYQWNAALLLGRITYGVWVLERVWSGGRIRSTSSHSTASAT